MVIPSLYNVPNLLCLALTTVVTGTEGAVLYAQAGAPSTSATANVVIMGQDEFHDALESAAEAASTASTSDRQHESG